MVIFLLFRPKNGSKNYFQQFSKVTFVKNHTKMLCTKNQPISIKIEDLHTLFVKIQNPKFLNIHLYKNGLKCSTKMAINPPKMIQITPNSDQYCISMVSRHILKRIEKFEKNGNFLAQKLKSQGQIYCFLLKFLQKVYVNPQF